MTIMTSELYEALKSAGAPEDQAKSAAEAVAMAADTPRRLTRVEDGVTTLKSDMADVKADVRLLKWMLGFNLAATMGVLWLLLRSTIQ